MVNKILTVAVLGSALLLGGCQRDAQVASSNLSKAADMFEVNRRVVFYNGITGEYILTVEGLALSTTAVIRYRLRVKQVLTSLSVTSWVCLITSRT